MIRRVAYLSMHTSPLLEPGSGDAGGMNVYINELAATMAKRGVDVVVFTRSTEPEATEIAVGPNYRVVHIPAGPPVPLPVGELDRHVAEFAENVIKWSFADAKRFDVVHSHYWLSGWAGVLVKESLEIPLANSFHTLGRVKDRTRRSDEAPSSPTRLITEEEVIARSDCVVASTPYEFEDLLEHYGASPERLCTSPPGVDHTIFRPGDRTEARRWLGLGEAPVILVAGRIQALKGIDVALAAVRMLRMEPLPELVVVGGPSGPDGLRELERLRRAGRDPALSGRVHFLPPQPHSQLSRFYQAADVLLMPSRSESFGLVAAEAQACGLPVIAAAVGGLPFVVADGVGGLLVEGHDPEDYATALGKVLGDEALRNRLSTGAVAHAEKFSWPATADRLLELYAGITDRNDESLPSSV